MFSMLYNDMFGKFFQTRSFWSEFISLAIILIEAFGLNRILNNIRLFERIGMLPSLCFVLITNLIPYPYQGQMLLVNGAMLLSLYYMINSFKKEKANGTIMLAGFFTGIAASFNNNLMIFLWLSIALFAMRPASLREWILTLIGFILPFYFMVSIFYLSNKIDPSLIFQFPPLAQGITKLDPTTTTRSLVILLLGIIGLVLSGQAMRKMLIIGRKTIIISFQLFIITLISCLLTLNQFPYNLYLMSIPVSILIIPLFTSFKRHIIPNLALLLMVILSSLR